MGRLGQGWGMIARSFCAAGACFTVLLLAAAAHAQTAADYNRASQAIQICASPMGATLPECAKLKGGLGLGGGGAQTGSAGLGGLGGARAGAATGLLSAVMGAANRGAAPATATPRGPDPQALQNAIALCVRNAGGNASAIQACLAIADTRPASLTAGPPLGGTPSAYAPQPGYGQNAALGIHAAGQSYQACVAARPNDWQACVQSSDLTGQPPR